MKNFRSVLSLVLAVMMVFSFTAFAAETDTTNGAGTEEEANTEVVTKFSDVDENSTVGKAVGSLAQMGVITGYPDGTFLPDGNITRAEFSAICVRLANLGNGLGTDALTGFSDLDADDSYKWARPYVLMAKGQGIINGYDDGTFRPGNHVTYEEAVAMLMRLRGWDTACKTETTAQMNIDPKNTTWSYGYIKLGIQQGLTKNTNSNEVERVKAASRGTVALLASNALNVDRLVAQKTETGETYWEKDNNSGGSVIGSNTNDKYTKLINGTVIGTFLTNTAEDGDTLGANEIQIDGDDGGVYEVQKKVMDKQDLYELLGHRVRLSYDTREDIVTSIVVNDLNSTKIYSGCNGDRNNFVVDINEEGAIEYTNNPETFKTNTAKIRGKVVYNGKYIEDFEPSDIIDGNYPFTNGVIEIISTSSGYITKITNYNTYVVNSTSGSSSSSPSINFLYKTGDDRKMMMPDDTDSDYFIFRKSGKSTNIERVSEISKFDVLSILESPSEANGPTIKIIEVTRNSKTNQRIDGVCEDDNTIFEIDGKYYQYNYEYSKVASGEVTTSDDVPELERGTEGVNFYLDHMGQIAAVAASTGGNTSYNYGYLLSLRQNDKDSDYDLEFYIMNQSGEKKEYGTGSSIIIGGTRFKTKNEEAVDALERSADDINSHYISKGGEVTNQTYQQPIRFKLNSSGLVSEIVTAVDAELDKVADSDEFFCNFPYDGERGYSSSSYFTDFRVSSQSKIFYIPDNRTDYDEYRLLTSSAFTSGNKYNVEAYNIGVTATKRADFILVYKTNDAEQFNFRSPFLIVTDTDYDENDNLLIEGYKGTTSGINTSKIETVMLNTRKLSDEAREIYDNLGKGDIVRYLTDTDGKVIDLIHWLDASDPVQNQTISDIGEVVDAKRILEIRNNSSDGINGETTGSYYNAGFRLAYGTVLNIDTVDKVLTVSPTLYTDDMEMAETGRGVVTHKYSTNTKVLRYDKRKGAEIITENGFDELQSYYDAEENASVIVTFTTGDSTSSSSYFRMVYIIQ